MKSKDCRESEQLLRNRFSYDNDLGIPVLKKENIDIYSIELISFDNIKINENKNN